MKNKILLLLLFSISLSSALAQNNFSIRKVYLYADSLRKENIESVSAPSFQHKFNEIPSDYGLPQNTMPFWVKIIILNKDSVTQRASLNLSMSILNEMLIYSGPGYQHIDSIGLKHEYELIPYSILQLAPGENIVYAKTQSFGGAYNISLHIDQENTFYQREGTIQISYGLYYGFLFTIMLVNIFYWITLRKKIFGYYALFVLATIMLNSGMDGLPFLNIAGNFGTYNKHVILLSILMYFSFTPLVAIEYLQIGHKYPRLYKTSIFALCFSGLSIIIAFIFDSEKAFESYFIYHNITLLLNILLVIIIAVKGFKEKTVLSKSFILAFSVLAFFLIVTILETNGVTNMGLSIHGAKIGSVFEIIILSFGLALYFKTVESGYNKVQQNFSDLEDSFLRTQMNPHFLFNVLGSIQNRIAKNDKEGATELINKFSAMVRNVVDHSREEFVVMDNEIKFLKDYISLQTKNLDNFQLKFNVDESIDTQNTLIPNMLLQPFIENAILHGLAPLKGRTPELSIQLIKKGKQILCSIKDNGTGLKEKAKISGERKSIGISNTRERLEKLSKKYQQEFYIRISDLSEKGEQGTLVELALPFEME
ncbi:MAG: sensor histidine kinase [Flavobacteriales bacterium]